jgi:hypothetical protein
LNRVSRETRLGKLRDFLQNRVSRETGNTHDLPVSRETCRLAAAEL